ncbi:MutS protein msh4 [Elasticomyces elasticus]|uniref:MutS protein msh4 n=1 Tax=Elasticomyces elasticus TaxID=574655 RepID=A0AAN7ZWT6_9PEZI|nr:MutS protein msh4 [Elasticomyces elasticus]
MATNKRTSTSYTTATRLTTTTATGTNQPTTSNPFVSTSNNPFYTTAEYATTTSRPRTGRRSTGRPGTGRPSTARPRTGISTLGAEDQEIVCAISESRGISPTVGLAFVNLDTGEAVLSQINDRQTYVLTIHKLMVFNPTNILVVSTASSPKSKLFSIIEDNLQDIGSNLTLLDRRYWAETTGLEYIQQLAFAEDAEALKTAVSGNYYAVCCFAAVLKYVELGMSRTFPFHSLRIKYEPSEGSMMIDLSTIRSLELVQNLHNAKSKDCLFGLLNETLTPMGGRLLRSNILQPLTNPDTLNTRWDAIEELSTKEEMFFAVRTALKPFLDVDKTLTQLILIAVAPSIKETEQAVNNVIMLKQFVSLIKPVFESLTGARSTMVQDIRNLCASENVEAIQDLISKTINEDTTYATQPLDLRNQRTYAVKSGVNGLLDVARLTYKEAMTDALQHMTDLSEEHNLPLQRKFDNTRQFYLRLKAEELEQRDLPAIFINVYRKKDIIECQTLDLMKRNQKIADAHTEVLMMSDAAVQELIGDVREHLSTLFKISEALAMLDLLAAFAQLITSSPGDYTRPSISETLALRAARHPIKEKIFANTKFIPNDVYATQQTRFQIITGCNMSGKSTYIRSVALLTVMAQIGSFVPASYAALPITKQLFARVSMDDSIEANVSTFAQEMRETAFILRSVGKGAMVIMDELGRGTSTRDGLGIAVAIAEALVESRGLVWFATHFRDLANIMAERSGVVNLHLAVDMSEKDKMAMLYRIASGTVEEEHYGLKLARVVPLPEVVVEHAEVVAGVLERVGERRKKRSLTIVKARRRKLLLNLKEHLVQAKSGRMEGEGLRQWLKELQGEFVVRMLALDEEARKAELGVEDSEEEGEEDGEEGEREREGTAKQRGGSVEMGGVEGDDYGHQRFQEQAVMQSVEHVDGDDFDSQAGSRRSVSAHD